MAFEAGLAAYTVVLWVNSFIHSYPIMATREADSVSLDLGFHSMAHLGGGPLATLLSGWDCPPIGMEACLWASALVVGLPLLGRLGLLPLAGIREIGLPELQI